MSCHTHDGSSSASSSSSPLPAADPRPVGSYSHRIRFHITSVVRCRATKDIRRLCLVHFFRVISFESSRQYQRLLRPTLLQTVRPSHEFFPSSKYVLSLQQLIPIAIQPEGLPLVSGPNMPSPPCALPTSSSGTHHRIGLVNEDSSIFQVGSSTDTSGYV